VSFTESDVEQAALDWFQQLDYDYLFGPDIASDGPHPERTSFTETVLTDRLRQALARINPRIPSEALDDAVRKVARTDSPSLIENNRRFHRMLVDGVDVAYQAKDGRIVNDKVWLINFEEPENNDWLAVNQFTVIEGHHNRRPDVVVFVNGLPLAVLELKNLAVEEATARDAFNQFQTYKHDIPSLFLFNGLLVASDGIEAKVGTLTSDWGRFMPWRTVEGDVVAPAALPALEVLLKGIFEKERFLSLVRDFLVFETDGVNVAKKLAGYHQFHAVNKAVVETVRAASPKGDRRIGVIWHTQGSGKSLTMAFYAGKLIRHPSMFNPTLVVITDRNDLDNQLFGTFVACQELLRQTPIQAEDRRHLRELLNVASGGVIFTTVQKFFPDQKGDTFPLLSDRRNIVVIADEAHRSQYDFIDGFARHLRDALPNASFIGFTGTPIETTDKSTPAVFGNYIDVYDIERAVEDGATVRIYYEGRLAKIELREDEKPKIDPEFEEVTESEEEATRQQLRSKWARLESLVGAEKRVGLIAQDLIDHFERRLEAMDGKAMIVCMSRRICVDLYKAIVRLRPTWHHDDDEKGAIKVVMTGCRIRPSRLATSRPQQAPPRRDRQPLQGPR
jgi:type I restriction enzyme R subunit